MIKTESLTIGGEDFPKPHSADTKYVVRDGIP